MFVHLIFGGGQELGPREGDQTYDNLDSRAALLQASGPIFAEKGLEGATVKEIAEAASVNVALISYHFGGKEGLFRAVIDSMGRERLDAAERALQPAKSLEEFRLRLRMFMEEFMLAHLRNPHQMKIIHRDFDGGHPIAVDAFRGVILQMFMRVKSFLEAGKNSGFLRHDLDADSCAAMMFGGMTNCVRMNRVRKEVIGVSLDDPDYLAKFVDQLVKNFCEGAFVRGEQ